jgi:putative peptide zinc metalloprotease protein
MLRLKKNLQVTPPTSPGEKIKITDPSNGKTLFIGPQEVRLLRLIARFPVSEVANQLKIPESRVFGFIQLLQNDNLLEALPGELHQSKNGALKLQPANTTSLSVIQNTSELPAIELRPDLELIEDEEKLLIEDPVSGRFFSLGLSETALVAELSQKPLLKVSQESNHSPEELSKFIDGLSAKGLLIRPAPKQEPVKPPRTLLSLLVNRFKLCNPDQFLGWTDRTLGWLWKGPLSGLHFAVILFGAFLWLDQSRTFMSYGFPKIFDNFWLNGLLFMGIVSFILGAHELAHGLTLKSFGGSVPEMGLFLLYGFPSAYTNVSGAYKLKQKSAKIWVLLAGVLFQAWIGCLSFVLWSFSVPHTWLSDLAYMFSFASFVNLAVNLNPLIKLDGYYLLTLLSNKPNLRGKSWDFITSGFRGAKSAGEGLLFFVYGLLSVLYTGTLLFFMFKSVFNFGLANAPFLSALAVVLLILASKTHLPATSIKAPKTGAVQTSTTPNASLAKSPGQFLSGAAPKPYKSSNWPALIIFVLLIASLFVEIPHQVGGEGEITPTAEGRAIVRSPIQGVVQKVYVKSGDRVKAGDRLVEILDWGLMEQLTQTAGGNAMSGGGAPRLQESASQIEQAKINAQKLNIELQKAQLTYANNMRKAETFTKLAKEGAFSKNSAQEAILSAQLAQQDIARLNKELQLNREAQRAAGASFQTLSGQISFYRQKSGQQIIKSPIAGQVLTEDIDLSRGAMTSAQETLLSVADLSKVQVKIKVVQEDLPLIKLGQAVKLSIRAYPGQAFKGLVSDIALASEDPKKADPTLVKDVSRKHWNVTMTIENKELLLKPGMSGYAFIDSSERRKVWQLIGREVYRVFSLERFAVLRESLAKSGF